MAPTFQLGLELTNIVNPLSQVVSAIGSLHLLDAIRKSGSDVLTETRLASLLGRHRIEKSIEFHFREAVAKSEQSFISRYVDIVLEAGAGPTVQESLKNPALFSMVIQLSMLSFSHEVDNLADAIVEAIDRIVKSSGGSTDIVPDYGSLIGTLRACQEQTAAFRWALLYESVENRIESALKDPEAHAPPAQPSRKRRKVSKIPKIDLHLADRHLPFPIMQSLMMWLQSLQSFPEHRILHIKADSGITTIIVWCYHILGIGLNFRSGNVEICFGKEPRSIVIETAGPFEVRATLMDAANPHEPLFSLAIDENDPGISYEHRAGALGFGRKVLIQANAKGELIRLYSHWVIAQGLAGIRYIHSATKPIKSNSSGITGPRAHSPHQCPSEADLMNAGKFAFALDEIDCALLEEYKSRPIRPVAKLSQVTWRGLVALVITFARIDSNDLESCADLPLSLYAFQQLGVDHRVTKNSTVEGTRLIIEPLTSFNILNRLLLGSTFSEGYVKPAVLVSAWGWSIFFHCFDASDPADLSVGKMRVLRGVPSRKGFRRARIIDGPSAISLSSSMPQLLSSEPLIAYYPGVSTAKRGDVLIGHQSDAFSITQMFEWHSMDSKAKANESTAHDVKKHKLGFRAMQELCSAAGKLAACDCEEKAQDPERWLDDRTFESRNGLNVWREMGIDGFINYPQCPEAESVRSQSQERVIVRQSATSEASWVFYVSDNPAARWLQLDDMINACGGGTCVSVFVRGKDTCLKCAIEHSPRLRESESMTSLVLL